MSQKRGHFDLRHVSRMPKVMKANEAHDPVTISAFRAQTVVSYPDHVSDLIEQLRPLGRWLFRDSQRHWRSGCCPVILPAPDPNNHVDNLNSAETRRRR